MNAEQKRAWLGVGSGVACVVAYLVILPFLGSQVAGAAFAILGLNGFAPLIGRGEKPDERDMSIVRNATLAGAVASYMTFILGCMGTWFIVFAWHREPQVSVHSLPMITFWAVLVVYLVRSAVILVLYNRHVEADNV